MRLNEIKVCEWCEKAFTGRRILYHYGLGKNEVDNSDDATCWCSYGCYKEYRKHVAEMEQLIGENYGLQRALMV